MLETIIAVLVILALLSFVFGVAIGLNTILVVLLIVVALVYIADHRRR